jgi:hypothetical protein
MTTSTDRPSNTSFSMGNWKQGQKISPAKQPSGTKGELKEDVVLVQGRYVSVRNYRELLVSVAPTEINRKLAIRHINEQLEGRTSKSNTYLNESDFAV